MTGSHVLKFLNLYVSGTNRDTVPNDRFPSVRDHIHATPTIKRTWTTQGPTVTGGS